MKRGESRRLRTGSPAHSLTAQWVGIYLSGLHPFLMHPVLFQIGSLIVPSYGAVAAIGVLLALALAQVTAKRCGIDSRHAWNMLVLAVFASLAVSRLVLIVMNLSELRRHPSWLLAVAMVHHPLLAAAGVLGGAAAVLGYVRWAGLQLGAVADCLAAPVALGMAAEQCGALLAGSDYGRETAGAWAVTYASPLAARWSGTPLGVPLHPVQAYAAVGALLLAAVTFGWLFVRRRNADVAGVWLVGMGALLFVTEGYRDWEGRGVVLGGLADIPQLVGLGLVVLGGVVLFDWRRGDAGQRVTDV
jgi:phosphatidylglycerol---prolipoprotein diacylglyceryl transferase